MAESLRAVRAPSLAVAVFQKAFPSIVFPLAAPGRIGFSSSWELVGKAWKDLMVIR